MHQSTSQVKDAEVEARVCSLDIDDFLAVDDLVYAGSTWAAAYRQVTGRTTPGTLPYGVVTHFADALRTSMAEPARSPSGFPIAHDGCSCPCHQVRDYPPHRCCIDTSYQPCEHDPVYACPDCHAQRAQDHMISTLQLVSTGILPAEQAKELTR